MKHIALFFIFGMSPLWANLITNSGFEQPNLSGNQTNATYAAGSNAIPGWLVTDFAPESVSIIRDTFTDGNLTFLAHSGDQSLNLTGAISGEAAGVLQHVQLQVGDLYQLTFWVGNQDNSVAHYSLDSEVELLINGSFVNFFVNGDNSKNAVNWKKFTYDFTATKANTSVQFQNATLSFDHYIGLDDVGLVDVTPAVTTPEAGGFGLMGGGLAVLGLRWRRMLADLRR
jgi:hypothetical protein